MLPGPAGEHSVLPHLPLNVLPTFAKLWEVTVGSAMSGRPNVVLARRIVVKFYGADLW